MFAIQRVSAVTASLVAGAAIAIAAPGAASADDPSGDSSGSHSGSHTGSSINWAAPARNRSDDPEAARDFAVLEAERVLSKFRDRLSDAEAEQDDAEARAQRAGEAEIRAERELSVARETARRTRREIDVVEGVADQRRKRLSAVAMAAYTGGDQTILTTIVEAEQPSRLADALTNMRVIARTHDRVLGNMAATSADLRDAHARLRHDAAAKAESADEAADARADAQQAAREAHEAKQKLARRREEYEHAVTLADEGKFDEYQTHLEMLGESSELDEYLDSLTYSTGTGTGTGAGFGTGTFTRPGTGSVTSPYGQRFHPVLGYTKLHTGTDFSFGDGTVYAADTGVVLTAGWMTGYGNTVVMDHGDLDGRRVTTLYAHQRDLRVRSGQKVSRGDVIGRIGSTGYSTGPHLHFEVRLDGSPTNPQPYLP